MAETWTSGTAPKVCSNWEPFLSMRLHESVTIQDYSVEVLNLLRVLNGLSRYWGSLYDLDSYDPISTKDKFLHHHLTHKVNQHLKDFRMVTTGKLPSWIFQLADSCKFLFPLETRALIFHMATFDRERALQQLKVFSPDSVGARIADITGLLPTKQITVNRDFILDETKVAFDRMLKYDNSAISEVKFTDEVSSYFLLDCHYYLIDVFYFSGRTWGWSYKRVFFDFIERNSKVRSATMARRKELGLEDTEVAYVHSANGLFPLAIPYKVQVDKIIPSQFEYFHLLGKVLAKSAMDSRQVCNNSWYDSK
ncbi:E3 ubiquitin-protein ligase TRIP12-like [Daphnia pulicaria]|uniref:E3 ubiquitin-protein ligase TRIP12-like n=1 Tax=Daphnia pulicaria TaxID=35523 RepID=UPI001EEAE0E3|nr:E3 ubiquitin-protein ligase TRIP12-like [Daphnia pulicaria]